MHNLKLPKEWLSFSQIDLWLKAKETYRKKYYGGVKFATTAAMEFGNKVTLAMAANEPWTAFIPRYPRFEREIFIEIEGIPIKAAIDSIRDDINQFCEYKTGKTVWTQNKVNKHCQLDLYSLLLEEEDGFVTDECYLIRIGADTVNKTVMMGDIELEGESTERQLTGEIDIFPRIITKGERQAMRELVVRVGREIEEDYAAFKHLYTPEAQEAAVAAAIGDLPRL